MPPDRPPRPPSPDYLFVTPEELAENFEEVRTPETELHFTVTDALNPFREALRAGGISETDPSAAERRDIEVNLKAILEADIASYRSTGPQGLVHWADALAAIKEDLRMTPEKRAIIEQEIKNGAIAVFMPGNAAQLATAPDQYQTCFNPVWIKDGAAQSFQDAFLWDHTAALITGKDPSLAQGIPERPYILFVKPTQKPEERTCKKTVDQQKQELKKINQEREKAGNAEAGSIKPAEYGALQKRFTEAVRAAAQRLTALAPLDTNAWTRFIDLPLSAVGYVPEGSFYPGVRRLLFVRVSAADSSPGGGFRPVVRVEI